MSCVDKVSFELTVAMVEAESFVKLASRKDKFESFKPNGKGNGGGDHEKDEEGHSDDENGNSGNGGNEKP